MTARKSIYTIIAAISVALFATVALISIGNIGAQTGPVAAADLTDIAGPECGGAGQAACTEGSIYLVSKRNGLTTSSAADGIRFDYVSAVGITTTITSLDYVGNGESLYATYRDENEGETGEARYQNAILENSDIVTVVVEDKDAVVSGPVEHEPSPAIGTTASSYNVIVDAIAQMDQLPILGDVTLFYDDNDDGIVDDGEEVLTNNVPQYRASVVDAGVPGARSAIVNVLTFGAIDASRTMPDPANPGMTIQRPLSLAWETASDSYVVVQVASPSFGSSFLRLAETSRGSGRFVGEVQLVALTTANENAYDDFSSVNTASGNVTSFTTLAATDPREAKAATLVVDGAQQLINVPVGANGESIEFRYRDKTGQNTSVAMNQNDVATTRSAQVTVEADAPEIELTSPVAAATSDRQPTFAGNVRDTGGSGLDVRSLRLVIDNDRAGTSNVGEVDVPAAINNGVFTLPTNLATSRLDTLGVAGGAAGAIGNPRVLVGSEDEDEGLYDEDTNYENGDASVDFSYTPDRANILLRDQAEVNGGALTTSQVDVEIEYRLLVYDLAGNVGFSDADTTSADSDGMTGGVDDNFQPHTLNIDGAPPSLIPANDTFTEINRGIGTDVRFLGRAQTGLVWDSTNERLEVNNRFIAVVFNDSVTDVEASDFEVDFSTDGVADPEVVRVVVPGNVTLDDFEASVTRRDELVKRLETTVFIEVNDDIPPGDTPEITVNDITDNAGNEIETDSAVVAEDTLGPAVTVRLSGGSGVGSDADNQGPATLTDNNITLEITSNEGGTRPTVTFYQSGKCDHDSDAATDPLDCDIPVGSPTTARLINRGADQVEFEFRYILSRLRPPSVNNDRVCFTVSVPDDNRNGTTVGLPLITLTPASTAATDGSNCGEQGSRGFQVDSTAPGFHADFDITPEVFELRPLVQIRLSEEVQSDVDVRVNNEIVPNAQVTSSDNQTFVYQPAENLELGEHTIEIRATDYAGNRTVGTGGFIGITLMVSERSDFELDLDAGWNLVSFPSPPVDSAVGSVFSNTDIEVVSTFDAASFRSGGAQQATRSNISGNFSGSLTNIRAGLAYWVYSSRVASQAVALSGPSSSSDRSQPELVTIPTVPAPMVNFVGVIDPSRAQTQDDAGENLMRGTTDVTVRSYLAGVDYGRIYAYENNGFVLLSDASVLTVGQGLLVFINADSSGRTAPIVP